MEGCNMNNYTEWRQDYVSQFLSMKCAGDVLNVTAPLGAKAIKEISESMAIIQALRPIALKHPMEYYLHDLCAGNALTSVLAVHLLPIKHATAIDIKPRSRNWADVDRFAYCRADIMEWTSVGSDIIISSHPCCETATKIVDLYLNSPQAKYLIMLPCCKGRTPPNYFPRLIQDKLTKYEQWAVWLAERAGGTIYLDKKCISPCNAVIVARKRGNYVFR